MPEMVIHIAGDLLGGSGLQRKITLNIFNGLEP